MRKRICQLLCLLLTIGLYVFVMDFLGIGCPIKFVTGISCAGCGMTRAWICVLRLDFTGAMLYHPLFFTVPFFVVLILYQERRSTKWVNRMVMFFLSIFIIVYVVRLLNPQDTVVEANLRQSVIWRLYEQTRRRLG